MFNRFKNVLYGSSSFNEEIQHDDRRSKREMRGRLLKKSASFREAFLSDSSRNNNNNNDITNSFYNNDKSIPTNGMTNDIDSQYSAMLRIMDQKVSKVPKFPYSRPEFLQLKTEDEILVSADHQIRPIILPRDASKLPWRSGYAECINSGKSLRNEDQAACYENVVINKSSVLENGSDSVTIERQLPWVYFGIFDGHAGPAVAVAAAAQLYQIIEEKLQDVLDLLIALEFDSVDEKVDQESNDEDDSVEYSFCFERQPPVTKLPTKDSDGEDIGKLLDILVDANGQSSIDQDKTTPEQPSIAPNSSKSTESQKDCSPNELKDEPIKKQRKNSARKLNNLEPETLTTLEICRNNVTVESLITGALESAFWKMDLMIARDKQEYKMAGGCTAVVGLFILGKLYVCNAGDSRAIVYKDDTVIPMSFDFTPISERDRLMRIGQQHPEFLGTEFTHLEFLKRPTRRDLGKQMLYKDAYMTGWSMKTIDYDDLRIPLVWGEGKRSRVLATMGVTRGFGDHELRAHHGSLLIKPFLTPEPEVRVLPIETDDTLKPEDVLIMGSDGLWDVTSNEKAAEIVRRSFDLFPDNEESRFKYRYVTAAQDLVIHSRGHATNWNNVWRIDEDKFASLDDIAVFVIPLKQYRDEYLEWKGLRAQAKQRANNKDATE